ncbi:hypothetical protein DY000_02007940 [Brassica cretica]|uniref:Uncharacterized protein n=1 Tax=Brassica cretica TaxID=69181 RepID=A0ABQ7C011_BRACR|nr:hypothetical protein DY000_02007940 [Brassica cretica]
MKTRFLGPSLKEPADSRTIHKSTNEASIDTLQAASIDSVNQASSETIQLVSDNTVDENGMLREEEGRTRNNAEQLINAQGAVIPDVIVVAEMNEFDLSREWHDWVGQDPFQGLPHQDPRNHIEELEDLVSRSEQNEVYVYHMLCKIFPYSLSGDAFR